jgi:hypothetical protein
MSKIMIVILIYPRQNSIDLKYFTAFGLIRGLPRYRLATFRTVASYRDPVLEFVVLYYERVCTYLRLPFSRSALNFQCLSDNIVSRFKSSSLGDFFSFLLCTYSPLVLS